MQKAVEVKPYLDDIGPPFSSRGFYLSGAYVQLEFGESVTCIQRRLLYTTSQEFQWKLLATENTKNLSNLDL